MEFISTADADFIKSALDMLGNKGELLALIRYSHQAGNRDFLIVRTKSHFLDVINGRKEGDCVTLVKSLDILLKGTVTKDFVQKAIDYRRTENSVDWLVIWEPQRLDSVNWCFVDNAAAIETELNGGIGQEVNIIRELDWFNDENSITAYAPDKDGIVRPGAY